MTRVLIIDDHPAFASAAGRLLRSGGYDVVGGASDGCSGVELARELHPDVVLLDIQLPDIDGFEVAARLRELDPAPSVVLISSRDATDYGTRVADAAACGFIGKADLTGARVAEALGEAT